MHFYLITPLLFLLLNNLVSKLVKKYTFEKFFTYVILYFIFINTINLIYIKSIYFFVFLTFFSVAILFLYSGLYRSVSIKVMIYLYFKKSAVNINNFYKNEFSKKSFDKRVKILIDNGFLIKKNKNFMLTIRGKKYLKMFQIIHLIYKIKSSG